MKIWFDNIIFSLQKAGGISVVWQNLIKNLLPYADDLHFIEYPDAGNNLFRQELELCPASVDKRRIFNHIFSQFRHPRVKSDEPFIFHSSYFRTCSNRKAINVTTVHDFIYEQGRPAWKQRLRIAMNYRAIRRSDAVVCISENTRRDLFKYMPDVDPEKVRVIYNGVSDAYFPLGSVPYPEYRDYVLFVGGRQRYKNFDFVVKALAGSKYKLLVCGAPLTTQEKEKLDTYLPGCYRLVAYPSMDELNKIYNSVYCLAYPSSYEGFGLPVLEAQRAGCPVIALDASSIPEIIGDNALLMSELSSRSFEKYLKELDNVDTRRKIVCEGIENAKYFSWNKMAQEYMYLYQDLLKNHLSH